MNWVLNNSQLIPPQSRMAVARLKKKDVQRTERNRGLPRSPSALKNAVITVPV